MRYNESHGGARNGAGRPATQLDERRLLLLRAQGFSIANIAARFDVKLHIVRYALDRIKRSCNKEV
jgi:DNA-directed RNA polymerase specialized sigma24 family protein